MYANERKRYKFINGKTLWGIYNIHEIKKCTSVKLAMRSLYRLYILNKNVALLFNVLEKDIL